MDIIERAARALCYADRDYQFCANNCRIKGECVGEIGELERSQARAVLAALREPDEGMIEAGAPTCHQVPIGTWDEALSDARDCWQAMIDQALKG